MSRTILFSFVATLVVIFEAGLGVSRANVPELYQPNYDTGYSSGYDVGYPLGITDGKTRGRTEGNTNGRQDGFTAGWALTHQPAFDKAFAEQFPIGRQNGWGKGVDVGFQAGYDWAPTLYGGGSYGSTVMINGGNWRGSVFSSANTNSNVDTDWPAHYYDLGFGDGKKSGFTTGSAEGYALTYPDAYAAAYPIGESIGKVEGRIKGFFQGTRKGYDDGWSVGYNSGYDSGFTAGVDFRLTGKFTEPVYGWSRVVPEPASFSLFALAGVLGLLRRNSRR